MNRILRSGFALALFVGSALAFGQANSASAEKPTTVHYRTENVDGLDIFYREAGPKDAPALLLLHGFPTSSQMFRNLIPALADYEPFVARTRAIFAGRRASRLATEEDVARVIFTAATDGSDRLRYVGTEDIQPWVKARREASEHEYMAFVKSKLLPES